MTSQLASAPSIDAAARSVVADPRFVGQRPGRLVAGRAERQPDHRVGQRRRARSPASSAWATSDPTT